MAAFDANRPFAAASENRTGNFFVSMIGHFAAWNDARQTRKSLNALSDRELEDIGLHRGEIDRVAYR